VSEQGISVTGYPDHKPCQVCGESCGGSMAGGYSSITILQSKQGGGCEELAYLCLKCYATGILYAAKQARESND
jgi:hypothetical protein